MKPKILSSCVLLLALAACQQIESTARAVSLSVSPTSVSNLYAGTITLQIGGLLTGETVRIDKFVDANGNGVIDTPDLPVQSFLLTDNQASVIGGVTNINVPGDSNPTSGAITAQLSIAGDVAQQIVAQYIFRVSSPTNRFSAITALFNVVNTPFAQSFAGTVKYGGSGVPYAVVMVKPGNNTHGSPLAGVMANNAGSYTLNLPGGTYSFYLFKSNYVANSSLSPLLTLTNGATFTTNLNFLIAATNSISGAVVDATNATIGLPYVFMICETPDKQLIAGGCWTGTNGAFTVPVIAGQWKVSMDSQGVGTYGYLGLNNNPQVDTTTGNVAGVALALPKATALFYGFVTNSQGQPFAGLDISCQDNNNNYQQDYYTGTNGYFVAPVPGGWANDSWQVQVSSDSAPTNYIFPQPVFDQNGGTNLDVGQALLVDFPGLLATNLITGYLTNNYGAPVAGVGVYAYATINGVDYNQGNVDTDANGHYSMNVANGSWSVGVNTCTGDCGDALPANYLAPPNQTVVIVNNNATVNFTAILATNQISGHVQQANSNSIGGVGVWASATISNVGYFQYVDANGSGNYTLDVANGSWTVGVECYGGSDSLDSILGSGSYQCPNNQTTNIVNNNGTVNFTVQPIVSGPYQIFGYVTNNVGNPIVGVGVYANDGNGDYLATTTGGFGYYSFNVTNGNWDVSVDCGDLSALDYQCVSDQYVNVSGNSVEQDFTVQPIVPDVLAYYVTKMEAYLQTGPATLVLNTGYGPFNAYVGLVQSALDVVPLASVILPTGVEVALPWGNTGIQLQTQESFPTQAAIDAAYPPGDYSFGLYGVDDGLQFPVLTMPSAAYPNAPQVSNFAAAQAINPLSPFTLQWNAIPGATANDYLWVFAIDNASGNMVISTPNPATNALASLNGTATSVIIPTNTFHAGHAYTGWITLFHNTSVNTNDYPGAWGTTIMAAATAFPAALASASSSPVLSEPARLSSTLFQFQLSGMAGTYTVLYSTNAALRLSNWSMLLTTGLETGPVLIQDTHATNKARFYRAEQIVP